MDGDGGINRRHYAEIYRKLNGDGFRDVARHMKAMIGLTDREINGAVGRRYWGLADDVTSQQRALLLTMFPVPPPPWPPYRNHYAEICRKLVEDGFPVEAVTVKRMFRLTHQEVCGATFGSHYWDAADGIVTWADSLFQTTPPPTPPANSD